MLFCNWTTPHLKKEELHSPLYVFMIMIFILLIIPSASGLSFNVTSFLSGEQEITYEGDAYPADHKIQLIKNLKDADMNGSVGRATYHKPLHLWDKASGNVTDFTTHFSFVIDSLNNSNYGDGLAFFLAPNGSKLPFGAGGFTLGLSNDPLNTTANSFVAVEFDIYNNDFESSNSADTSGAHVGIDINSLQSKKEIAWLNNDIVHGQTNEAWISYNSATNLLSVSFITDFGSSHRDNYTQTVAERQNISQIIYLKDCLPEWVTFGFTGSTGDSIAIHSILSWDFNSTLPDNIVPINIPGVVYPPTPSESPNLLHSRKNKTTLVVGLGVGGGVLALGVVLGLIWLIVIWCRKKNEEQDDGEPESGVGPRKFSYRELVRATHNFNEKLGEGAFGGVYKGFLRDMNSFVAVKKISSESKQGIKEYGAEVKIIGSLRHRNLVQLIGWCREGKKLLLVYEFMPNGSLESHLYDEKRLLEWEVRYKVAKDLASGLLYLHEEGEECVVHRDIKPSNIMLDLNFNAKLGDFGLARFVDPVKGSRTTVLAGTIGYMAPECSRTGKTSKESDVYSFGVVALEIACGRKPIDPMATEGNQVDMVSWIWELYGSGNLLEAADPRLGGHFDELQMERLMMVGLWCSHPNGCLRPSIRQSTRVLDFEDPLPVLPAQMPDQPAYFPTPTNAS